jgi:hypothetical protein
MLPRTRLRNFTRIFDTLRLLLSCLARTLCLAGASRRNSPLQFKARHLCNFKQELPLIEHAGIPHTTRCGRIVLSLLERS